MSRTDPTVHVDLARSADFEPSAKPEPPKLDEPIPAPGFSLRDPDGDGRPGISWQSVAVLALILTAVGLLSWQGVIDLGRLLELALAGGGVLSADRLRKPAGGAP